MASGVAIRDYWRSTPHELNLAARGRSEQVRTLHMLFAWHLAPILNMVLPKGHAPVTPADLLGEKRQVNNLNRAEILEKAAKLRLGIE